MGNKIPYMGIDDKVAPEYEQPASSHRHGLADALFPAVRQKVLALFFGQPDRSFTISEVIERARAGSGAVQREVARLGRVGLILSSARGRQKEYQANPDSPVFDELRALARKLLGPAEQLRKAIAPCKDSIALAILYGSLARGTERADSDVDVLLVSDELALEDVFRLFQPVEKGLERRVNPTLYTMAEYRRRRQEGNAFLEKVLGDDYIVLKDDADGSLETG